ncbi:MAG TPA: TorF family putative porin, partial [Burkholderiaceae bacterium]|nr:TorF family putative porin [Burkholderiaceae bacterium]
AAAVAMPVPSPRVDRLAALTIVWAVTTMFGAPAHAQLGATVGIDSDYRFRGVSLSDSKPTLRLTVNHDVDAGAWAGTYLGASLTRADVRDDTYVQTTAYAGYVTRPRDGRSVEAGLSVSHFNGDASSYDYGELYAGVLASRWSLRVSYSPDYFGQRVQTLYADASAHHVLDERTRLFAHVGALVPIAGAGRHSGPDANRSRADLRVGVGWTLQALDLQIAWTAASRGGPYPAVYAGRRSAWVASAAYSF